MQTTLESTQVGNQVVTTVRRLERDGSERTEIVSACEVQSFELEADVRGFEMVLDR